MGDVNMNTSESRPTPFRWLLSIWLHPTRVFAQIFSVEKFSGIIPLLLATLLVILRSLLEGPLRSARMLAEQMANNPDLSLYPPEQQQAVMESMASQSGFVFSTLFPMILAVLGIWVSWYLLGSILHLGLTLAGSRSTNLASLNLAAWGGLPLSARLLLQILATLVTNQLIIHPGLSGFYIRIGGWQGYISALFGLLDLFLVWQVVWFVIGARMMSGLSTRKAVIVVLVAMGLLLLLQALPNYLTSVLSSVNITRPFFF